MPLETYPACGNSTARPLRASFARLFTPLLDWLVRQIKVGTLTLVTPAGAHYVGEGTEAGAHATLHLHRWRPLWRLLVRGDIGLAESYRDGDWSTPDLTALLLLGIANESAWRTALTARAPVRLALRLAHLAKHNSRRGSRRNIAAHYDLGNDFYREWLDADLIYSSAIYRAPDATLEVAQREKLARIHALLNLDGAAPQAVLEIGCGWGALACRLAQSASVHVTGVTLSTEQLAHAQDRVVREGLADRVQLSLTDYRDVQGDYDRIVSIEMIEAVGEAYWPTYFATLRDRLRPGGRAVVQAITIADAHFAGYRDGADFIQRYIFPGGMLPSPGSLAREAAAAGLTFTTAETFGESYARTLVDWRERFQSAWPQIAALGFDARFRRLWEYYLCYCEAGFRSGRVDVGLYVFERPNG